MQHQLISYCQLMWMYRVFLHIYVTILLRKVNQKLILGVYSLENHKVVKQFFVFCCRRSLSIPNTCMYQQLGEKVSKTLVLATLVIRQSNSLEEDEYGFWKLHTTHGGSSFIQVSRHYFLVYSSLATLNTSSITHQ